MALFGSCKAREGTSASTRVGMHVDVFLCMCHLYDSLSVSQVMATGRRERLRELAVREESSSERSVSPCPGDTLPWNLPKHQRVKRSKSASAEVLDPAERAVIRIAVWSEDTLASQQSLSTVSPTDPASRTHPPHPAQCRRDKQDTTENWVSVHASASKSTRTSVQTNIWTMAMYEPLCLPPNADEQDFIQAYENVREKYK
ncbi:hypothetical protein P4O66_010189, partial [Electrophorus voltai]